MFTNIEAYYGQPSGSCSCPDERKLVTGDDNEQTCPGKVDYSNSDDGECDSRRVYEDDDPRPTWVSTWGQSKSTRNVEVNLRKATHFTVVTPGATSNCAARSLSNNVCGYIPLIAYPSVLSGMNA